MKSWEQKSLAIINPTINLLRNDCESGSISEQDLRRILSKKYPFGQRTNHPCQIWCKCVNLAIADVFGSKQTEIDQLPLFEVSAS
jgi:hypothetical protein